MRCLADTDLLFLDGLYLFTETKPEATTSLTLVPPCTFGPPEKVAIDQVESDMPGIVWYTYGQGQSAYFPWTIDALYHRHSSPGHDGAFTSALLALCPDRQVISNANPQVEFALFGRGQEEYVLNVVNTSGHHGTAFFAPVPMHDVEIKLKLLAKARTATSLKLGQRLTLWQEDDYTCLNLDVLELFDTIQLK
jgi:hypothetical protein